MKLHLEKYLRQYNLSGAELARKLHVTTSLINHYLSGRREPSKKMENAIAEFFHVEPYDLYIPPERSELLNSDFCA